MYIGTTLGDVDPNITTFPEALETQLSGVDRDTSGIENRLHVIARPRQFICQRYKLIPEFSVILICKPEHVNN